MKFSQEDQETTFVYDPKKGEWTGYTCYPPHIRLFASKIAEISEELEVLTEHEGIPSSIKFKLPKDSINPRNFIKKKRVMSETQLSNLRKKQNDY